MTYRVSLFLIKPSSVSFVSTDPVECEYSRSSESSGSSALESAATIAAIRASSAARTSFTLESSAKTEAYDEVTTEKSNV